MKEVNNIKISDEVGSLDEFYIEEYNAIGNYGIALYRYKHTLYYVNEKPKYLFFDTTIGVGNNNFLILLNNGMLAVGTLLDFPGTYHKIYVTILDENLNVKYTKLISELESFEFETPLLVDKIYLHLRENKTWLLNYYTFEEEVVSDFISRRQIRKLIKKKGHL